MDKEKFNSRKYRFVLIWNIFMIFSVLAQIVIVAINPDFQVTLPIKTIIIITGSITASYFGWNILQKKINNNGGNNNGRSTGTK